MARPTAVGSARGGRPARQQGVAWQRGVAFLALLLVIAAMGATLAAGGSFWHHVRQREKERELLFVGLQYRRAIGQYYESSLGAKRYPPTLDALLLDPRQPAIRRYLRRPYRDPLTDSTEWGLIMAPEGGIMGVHSLSGGKPIKQARFPRELDWTAAEGGGSYADWRFVYRPAPPR